MLKGGYQIIDLHNVELDDSPYLMRDLYDRLMNNHNKVVMLSNINIEGFDFKDYFVQPIIDGTDIKCTIGDKTLLVTEGSYVAVVDGIIGGGGSGTSNYNDLSNRPQINGTTLSGNKTGNQLGLQKTLIPGDNILLDNDGTISAIDTSDYEDLIHKPYINGHEVIGNQLASHYGLQNTLTPGTGISIDRNNVISATGGSSYSAGTGIHITSSNKVFNMPQAIRLELDSTAAVFSTLMGLQVGGSFNAKTISEFVTQINPSSLGEFLQLNLGNEYPIMLKLAVSDSGTYDTVGNVYFPFTIDNNGNLIMTEKMPVFCDFSRSSGWIGLALLDITVAYDQGSWSDIWTLTIKRIS